MWRKLCQFVMSLLPDSFVQKRYVNAGADFGGMVRLLPGMGKAAGFDECFERWARWESEYARRGFCTVDIEDFCSYGIFITDYSFIGLKRKSNEIEVLYAEQSREYFIEGYHPDRMIHEAIRGNSVHIRHEPQGYLSSPSPVFVKVMEGNTVVDSYEIPGSTAKEEPYDSVLERE